MKYLSILLFFILINQANASLIFDDSVGGEITVSWDESFTLTSDPGSDYVFLTFKDVWDTIDGVSYWWDGDILSMTNALSINGDPALTADIWTGWQFRGEDEGGTYNNLDFVAGTMNLSSLGLNIGDVLSFVGTMTVNTLEGSRRMPDNMGPYESYLARGEVIFSEVNSVSVPEPSAITLMLLALIGFSTTRSKIRNNTF